MDDFKKRRPRCKVNRKRDINNFVNPFITLLIPFALSVYFNVTIGKKMDDLKMRRPWCKENRKRDINKCPCPRQDDCNEQ